MLQPAIVSVQACSNLTLLLAYETGEVKQFDVAPYVDGPWYGELNDPAYFATVRPLPNGFSIA